MHALLVIDLQPDFLPGGSLAVPDGDAVLPVANTLLRHPRYGLRVATQDWHPAGHRSFASAHPGRAVGDVIDLDGLQQILWPDHCVQHTRGAALADTLDTGRLDAAIQKGTAPSIDSYSGFFDNGHRASTSLADLLRDRGVTAVDIVGLALDYCVQFTALDAAAEGFTTRVLLPGCRAVNLKPGDDTRAVTALRNAGVTVLETLP